MKARQMNMMRRRRPGSSLFLLKKLVVCFSIYILSQNYYKKVLQSNKNRSIILFVKFKEGDYLEMKYYNDW